MCRVVSQDLRFYCKPKTRQLFVIALRAVRYCSPNEGKKENAKEGNCILGVVHKLRWQDFGFFWPPIPLRWHFLPYERWQKVEIFGPPTPSSCKRSLWMAPMAEKPRASRKRSCQLSDNLQRKKKEWKEVWASELVRKWILHLVGKIQKQLLINLFSEPLILLNPLRVL